MFTQWHTIPQWKGKATDVHSNKHDSHWHYAERKKLGTKRTYNMICLYKVLEEAKVIYSKKRKAIACIVCSKID